MVLAPLEAVTAPWSVQPNIYVDEETTQVGGGKGLTVCLRNRSHKVERVTGRHTNTTALGPTVNKTLLAGLITQASVLNWICDFEPYL